MLTSEISFFFSYVFAEANPHRLGPKHCGQVGHSIWVHKVRLLSVTSEPDVHVFGLLEEARGHQPTAEKRPKVRLEQATP